jgi:enoyl reductase-like protein
MELTIDKKYINQAIRIMNEYDGLLKQMDAYQAYLDTLKESVIDMQKKLEKLSKDDATELEKSAKLQKFMTDHEILINKEQTKIQPYLDNLEKLRKETEVIYSILKEQYPGASDNQLKDAILKQIKNS